MQLDFDKLNALPPDIKVRIAKARALMEETTNHMREQGTYVSLPYKMQLKSDIAELERMMKKLEKGRYTDKFIEKFDFNVVKLQTEADNILYMYK